MLANPPDLAIAEREDGQDLLLVATMKPEAIKRNQEYALKQNITTLHNRINELGVAEPVIQQQGAERIVVRLGVQDVTRQAPIGRTATLEIRMVAENSMNPETLAAAAKGQVPFGTEYYVERNGQPLLVRQVVLTGDRLTDAQPGFDNQTNEPAVHLRLDGQGAHLPGSHARERQPHGHPAHREGQGRSDHRAGDPQRDPGGRVQISGRMTTTEATDVYPPPRCSPRRWRSSRSAPSARAWAATTSRRASTR